MTNWMVKTANIFLVVKKWKKKKKQQQIVFVFVKRETFWPFVIETNMIHICLLVILYPQNQADNHTMWACYEARILCIGPIYMLPYSKGMERAGEWTWLHYTGTILKNLREREGRVRGLYFTFQLCLTFFLSAFYFDFPHLINMRSQLWLELSSWTHS